jgi:hypothetical protein
MPIGMVTPEKTQAVIKMGAVSPNILGIVMRNQTEPLQVRRETKCF